MALDPFDTVPGSTPADTRVFQETGDIAHAVGVLIRQAQGEVWLVSPYVSLADLGWLKRSVLEALRRGVEVHMLVREDRAKVELVETNAEELVAAGLDLRCLPDLHAKLYWSDQAAIVTSLNLLASSMNKSIELGIQIGPGPMHEMLRNFIMEKVVPFADDMPKARRAKEKSDRKARSGKDKPFWAGIVSASTRGEPRPSPSPRTEKKPRASTSHDGHCIRCGDGIKFNPDRPLCRSCYGEWAQWENDEYEEDFCHACGDEVITSMARPLCRSCYRAHR